MVRNYGEYNELTFPLPMLILFGSSISFCESDDCQYVYVYIYIYSIVQYMCVYVQ